MQPEMAHPVQGPMGQPPVVMAQPLDESLYDGQPIVSAAHAIFPPAPFPLLDNERRAPAWRMEEHGGVVSMVGWRAWRDRGGMVALTRNS